MIICFCVAYVSKTLYLSFKCFDKNIIRIDLKVCVKMTIIILIMITYRIIFDHFYVSKNLMLSISITTLLLIILLTTLKVIRISELKTFTTIGIK